MILEGEVALVLTMKCSLLAMSRPVGHSLSKSCSCAWVRWTGMAAQTCGLHDHHVAVSWPCRWQSPNPHRIVDPTTNHHPHLISWLPFTGSEFFWLVCKVQMCDLLYDEGIEEMNFCFSSFDLVEMFKQYWSLPSKFYDDVIYVY